MKFESTLVRAVLIKRYKRFLADVRLDSGEVITVHCANTGSMKTCGSPGDIVFLSHHPSSKRKLAYTWELTQTKNGFIGVNTHLPNRIVEEAFLCKKIEGFTHYDCLQKEVKHGTSRIDIHLSDPGQVPCWVEVKNVTLCESDTLFFPDAVSTRAIKHLQCLIELATQGDRAVIFFLINRPDGRLFSPAQHIHPEYAEALKQATKDGVEIKAYRTHTTLTDIELGQKVKVAHL